MALKAAKKERMVRWMALGIVFLFTFGAIATLL